MFFRIMIVAKYIWGQKNQHTAKSSQDAGSTCYPANFPSFGINVN